MTITLIAAIAQNNCIGSNGTIPWHIPEDTRRFKEKTMGHPVVMGRRTWESLPERFRPLPGRTNIVLTRQEEYHLPPGVERYTSLKEAIEAHASERLFVIGGGEVYREALPLADRLEITHVHQKIDGDAFFPQIDNEWEQVTREDHDGFSFVTYQRRP